MEQRISIVTVGVDDLDRAVRFYAAMGLKRSEKITDNVAFYQLGGILLALWPRTELARDAGIEHPLRGSGMALAYNTRSEAEVAEILDAAKQAGGRVLKPAARAFFGGVQGYFEDTEGNLWEVAYNAAFPIDADGNIALPA